MFIATEEMRPRLCENYFGKLKVVNQLRYPARNELFVGLILAYLCVNIRI